MPVNQGANASETQGNTSPLDPVSMQISTPGTYWFVTVKGLLTCECSFSYTPRHPIPWLLRWLGAEHFAFSASLELCSLEVVPSTQHAAPC